MPAKKLPDTFRLLVNRILHALTLRFSPVLSIIGQVEGKNLKLKAGDLFPSKILRTVTGREVHVPDGALLTHLQFRRFVGCPICNTHIAEMMKRAGEIKSAGIHEVIVFHSRAEEMRPLQEGVPFDLVADAEKVYYKEFGVEKSLAYILNLKAITAALRGMLNGNVSVKMTGGPLGLPADFLIEPNGRVLAAKYGQHAYDQWSVDELLTLAGSAVSGALH